MSRQHGLVDDENLSESIAILSVADQPPHHQNGGGKGKKKKSSSQSNQLQPQQQQQQQQQPPTAQQHQQQQQQQQPHLMVQHQNESMMIDFMNNESSSAAPSSVFNTIEEAMKNEISSMPMKTPVSILQELLSRRGITPSYELVQIEGAIHEPTFRYRVSFNDKDAMGAGKSKKEAKHAAAKMLLDKITNFAELQLIPAPPIVAPIQNGNDSSNDSKYAAEECVMGNPIGWLQELCMFRRWPPPCYETEMEIGLPHQRQFTIACVIVKFREIGQGKSKKIAKRMAAHKMWSRLQDTNLDPNDITNHIDGMAVNDENRSVTNILNRFGDLKDAHIPTLTNHHSFKVSQFHKTLKATFGHNLAKLQVTCLNEPDINFVQFLQDIAKDHQFEVTYVDIEERTYSGKHQCLVQLSTLPVAVCSGAGENPTLAQSSAALSALEYLKIMTKM